MSAEWSSNGKRIYGFPDWAIERRTDGGLNVYQGTKWFTVKADPEELAFVRTFAQALLEATTIEANGQLEMCMSPVATYSGSTPEMCALEAWHEGRCRP
jgi:hypothetical protein